MRHLTPCLGQPWAESIAGCSSDEASFSGGAFPEVSRSRRLLVLATSLVPSCRLTFQLALAAFSQPQRSVAAGVRGALAAGWLG